MSVWVQKLSEMWPIQNVLACASVRTWTMVIYQIPARKPLFRLIILSRNLCQTEHSTRCLSPCLAPHPALCECHLAGRFDMTKEKWDKQLKRKLMYRTKDLDRPPQLPRNDCCMVWVDVSLESNIGGWRPRIFQAVLSIRFATSRSLQWPHY